MENTGSGHLSCKHPHRMAIRITIPEPCSENWNAMTPQGDGRHCAQCCKVVVDFTSMEPREITDYLMQHREQKVCGRFSNAHLDTPLPWTPEEYTEKVALSPLTWLQKVAAIVVLAFGLMAGGCTMGVKSDSRTTGEPLPVEAPVQSPVDTTPTMLGFVTPHHIDTTEIMGKVAPVTGDTVPKKISGKPPRPVCVDPTEGQTMGVPELPEQPVIKGDVQIITGEPRIVEDTVRSGPKP